jgi:sortase A
MTRAGKAVRPVLRFVASVLICSGILMIADAGLTVTWQEPVSAFIAARQQGALDDQLEDADEVLATARAESASEKDSRKRIRRLAEAWREHVETGDAVGRIELPSLGRDYAVVQGTNLTTLRKGPGHYPKTPLPGEGGTIGVAGHRTTYGAPFRTVDKLDRGDELVMDMPYGRLTYEVEKTQVVPPTATWVTDRVPGRERLILSACEPLYSAAKRIIVFARLKSAELE